MWSADILRLSEGHYQIWALPKKKEKKKEKDKFEQIHLQLGKLNFKKKLEK